MDKYKHQSLLDQLSTNDRKIITVSFFDKPVRTSLLHFLGAENFFITEFGVVWDRQRIFPNKHGKVTANYQPLLVLDAAYPYHWVKLPTTIGELWLPVNQLLGWAFNPIPEIAQRPSYFLSEYPQYKPLAITDYSWIDTPPVKPFDSCYLDFMDRLYEVNDQ